MRKFKITIERVTFTTQVDEEDLNGLDDFDLAEFLYEYDVRDRIEWSFKEVD